MQYQATSKSLHLLWCNCQPRNAEMSPRVLLPFGTFRTGKNLRENVLAVAFESSLEEWVVFAFRQALKSYGELIQVTSFLRYYISFYLTPRTSCLQDLFPLELLLLSHRNYWARDPMHDSFLFSNPFLNIQGKNSRQRILSPLLSGCNEVLYISKYNFQLENIR